MTDINENQIKDHLRAVHAKEIERGNDWSYEGEALKLIDGLEHKFAPLHPVYHVLELGIASVLPVEREPRFSRSRRTIGPNRAQELLELVAAAQPYAQTEVFRGSIDVGFNMMSQGPCVTFKFFTGKSRTLSVGSDESAFLELQDILVGHGCPDFPE